MKGVIDLLVMFMAISALAWALGAILAGLLSRVPSSTFSPVVRLRRTAVIALLPWLLPASWAVALGAVAVGKRVGWLDDHCRIHGDGHPHFCFEHFPAIQLEPAAVAMLVAVLTLLLFVSGQYVKRALDERGRVNALLRLLPGGGLLRRIDEARPLALVARSRRPVVLISRGLLEGLSPRERRVVLAHEAAHLRRGDLLKSSFFEALLVIHLPGASIRLRCNWRQAIEERADDTVSRRFGRETTARTLLKVVRQQCYPVATGLAASGADVARRVERLLTPADGPGPAAGWIVGPITGLALASALPLAWEHHAIETLLGAILGG